jgi:hypothetical protein
MRGTDLGFFVVFSIPFAATFACGRTEPAVPNLAPPQEVEIPKASASPSSSASSPPTAVAAAEPPQPEDVKEAPTEDENGAMIGVLGSGGAGLWGAGTLGGSTGLGGLGRGGGSGGSGGFGAGPGSIGRLGSATSPSIRQGAVQVVGKLPPEVIQRIVRQNFGRFRLCYESGLRTNPALAGTVTIKLVIAKDGSSRQGNIASTDLPDKAVAACILRGFSNLSFPQPESGEVVVVYPLKLAPGTPPTPPGSAKPAPKPLSPPVPRASASQAKP